MRPEHFLPLHPLELRILISLLDGPRHGYEIVRSIEADRLSGAIYPANLYRRIRDLMAGGLLEETDPPAGSPDARRRYMVVTELGRRVASAEANRLATLLDDPRVRALLWAGPSK